MLVYDNYIGGEWRRSGSDELITAVNPANGEVVAKTQSSTKDDARTAITTSLDSFNKLAWKEDPKTRAKALMALAVRMKEKAEDLAVLMTKENGKLLRDSRGEILGSIDFLEFYAGLARTIYGRSVNLSPTSLSLLLREPLGVVGIIVPWNGPIILMMRSLAPALAAGNTVVIKPSSLSSAVTMEFARLVSETPEIPKGVVNIVTGRGDVVGDELVRSNEVEMISFTGDTETGKRIMQQASLTLKKVSLELGGKSPNIILDDSDFERAIKGAITGAAFRYSSQICYAGTRILVQDSLHQKFTSRVSEVVGKLTVGNGMDETVDVPPVVSKQQLERVMNYVEVGKRSGKLLVGGQKIVDGDLSRGNYVEPTVFDDVDPKSELAQQEIFGPILSIIPFSNEEEAIELANNTPYGLASAVWTRDLNKAIRLAKSIKAGTVWINTYGNINPSVEMSGLKHSGIGTMLGLEGLREFTNLKNVYFELDSPVGIP
jgi:betaine-aldehyde dehydrogenase